MARPICGASPPRNTTTAACRRASDSRAARAGATSSGRTWSSAAYVPRSAAVAVAVVDCGLTVVCGPHVRSEQKDTEYSGHVGWLAHSPLRMFVVVVVPEQLTRMNVVITQKEKEEAAARNGSDHGHGGGH
ncbi:hypothetical protein ON010_g5297 [Phytophthora cinnamomi]|nr:hypothetical protein ON010_g5297 [Phytophthora cinnamomi]